MLERPHVEFARVIGRALARRWLAQRRKSLERERHDEGAPARPDRGRGRAPRPPK